MQVLVESSTKYTQVIQVVVPDNPISGTMADLVLLKLHYGLDALRIKKAKKKEHWRQYAWNMRYLRKRLKEDKELVCVYCGKKPLHLIPADKKKTKKDLHSLATVDHIVARSNGGDPYDERNVCVACHPCNNRKGSRSVNEFIDASGKTPIF
jgi:hypothetical protein